MPTTAYVKPPNGEQIDVFSDGRAAEQKYARTPQQLVYAAKTRLPELTLKIPGIERPVQAGHIYAAAAHDLLRTDWMQVCFRALSHPFREKAV